MEPGAEIEDFTLDDQFGVQRSLYRMLESGPVVLFFYPGAMTKGCTIESCHFRDLKGQFESLGAQRVGISRDPIFKQREFSELHVFDFPLLSDVNGQVAARFGVRRGFGPLPVKRWTFVIGTDHRLIDVIKSEIRMELHADRALATLRSAASLG